MLPVEEIQNGIDERISDCITMAVKTS